MAEAAAEVRCIFLGIWRKRRRDKPSVVRRCLHAHRIVELRPHCICFSNLSMSKLVICTNIRVQLIFFFSRRKVIAKQSEKEWRIGIRSERRTNKSSEVHMYTPKTTTTP